MFVADNWKEYELLDASKGERLERWGDKILIRPDPQVIWNTPREHPAWRKSDGRYTRSQTGGGSWDKGKLPENWGIRYGELSFKVKPMNFKHTGIFPEQAANWDWSMEKIRSAGRPISVLNLFAYTGAATVACLAAGASVCHVDAAKGMVAWGKENAAASGVADRNVRWIVDDCAKFVEREIRRMCEALGLEVKRLKRQSIGPIRLGMLPTGKYRELTKEEINAIRNIARKESKNVR